MFVISIRVRGDAYTRPPLILPGSDLSLGPRPRLKSLSRFRRSQCANKGRGQVNLLLGGAGVSGKGRDMTGRPFVNS
jgi:hypothetical protein